MGKRGRINTSTIEDFQNIASSKGGKCLSLRYKNTTTKLEFECVAGHRWKAMPGAIKYGSWCGKCVYIIQGNSMRGSIDIYTQMAAERGGKCLSTEFKNNAQKLEFECAQGHTWQASGAYIKTGHWCSKCSTRRRGGKRKLTIESIQKLAQARGGKCLATEYNKSTEKLEFECAKGHRWSAVVGNVKHGAWCLQCFREKQKNRKRKLNKNKK
jgi:hypothetical protein